MRSRGWLFSIIRQRSIKENRTNNVINTNAMKNIKIHNSQTKSKDTIIKNAHYKVYRLGMKNIETVH